MGKRFGLTSLRGRYLYAAAIVALVVVAGTWFGRVFLANSAAKTTANIQERNQITHYSRLIRNAVWQAEYSLLAFMLAPSDQYQQSTRANFDLALGYSRTLRSQPWPDNAQPQESLEVLIKDLVRLRSASDQLTKIRSDAKQLFPAMKIMAGEMVTLNTGFYTAATEAMDDLATNTDPAVRRFYMEMMRTRHAWTLLIGAFRVYVANRLGTFGDAETGLKAQAYNTGLFYHAVLHKLARLKAMAKTTDVGLQARASLDRMAHDAARWHDAYAHVKAINDSDRWRTDIPYLQNDIQPLLIDVRHILEKLDREMEHSSRQDVGRFQQTAQNISRSQLFGTALVLLFIGGGFFYLERNVLRPITQVSQALREASIGNSDAQLPLVHNTETRHLVEAFREMHEQVRHRQSALEHQALHDALTGLPNRTLLQDRLQQAMLAAARANSHIALLMLDLDRFKEINDTLGHHVGDVVLKTVSQRLQQLLRKSDTVARLGGDEFAILLPMTDEEHALHVADRVVHVLEREMTIHDHKLFTSGSVGVALYPQHGANSQTLIKRADVAMYAAKRSNQGYQLYDVASDQHSVGRLALIGELHSAVERNGLALHYQPKMDLHSGCVVGVEALLRWEHAHQQQFSTADVIVLAEQTGIIKPLSQWVLGRALAECRTWNRDGLALGVSVNLSVWNLQDRGLAEHIEQLLQQYELAPERLTLEITESAMMAEPERAMDTLNRLGRMGIGLAVDDFGTGFSSLGYLKKLPVDELKIDRSFVLNMTRDENDAMIVRSTIDLAHNLGLRVVAEGVEDDRTLDLLRELGCDTAQGHHLGRPMAAEELVAWAAQSRAAKARCGDTT